MRFVITAFVALTVALAAVSAARTPAGAAGAMQIIIPEWVLQKPSGPQPGAPTMGPALKTITVVSENLTCKTIELTGPDDRNGAGDKVLIIGSIEDAGTCSGAGRELLLFDGLGRELQFQTTMKPDAIEIIEDLSPKPAAQQTRGLIVGTITVEGRGRLQDDEGRLAASTLWLCPADTSLPVLPLTAPPCSFANAKGGVFRAVRPAGSYFTGMPIRPEHLAGPHESIRVWRLGGRPPETMDVLRFNLPAGGVATVDLVLPSFYSDATPTPVPPRSATPVPAGVAPPIVGEAGLKRPAQSRP